MKKIVTRFAPSPTGHLHIGGLRTALFNYLYARANKGIFKLRIEDTDQARNSTQATQAILQAFNWVGLDYDDEVIYQSQRLSLYQKYIQKLLDEKKAYYCYMSKEELDTLRKKQIANKQTPAYDRRYRDFDGTPPKDIQPVIRIKAPLNGSIKFNDGIKGIVEFQAKEVDDFIIARSDGTPTYNFVVVIDDALMGITDIIRGDDHLSNTPKQIVIYNALDFKIPNFFHVPMILGSDGAKLSKRHGAMGVMEYKNLGYLPQALLNFLIRLGWSYGDEEIFSMQEMLEKFDATKLNTAPSCFNQEKLLWLNQHYLKQIPDESLNLISPLTQALTNSQREILFKELKNRSQTLVAFEEQIQEVLTPPNQYDSKMLSKCNEQTIILLQEFLLFLETQNFSHLSQLDSAVKLFMENKNIKANALMPYLRLSLLGKTGGIGIIETLFILGKQNAKTRIQDLCAKINKY